MRERLVRRRDLFAIASSKTRLCCGAVKAGLTFALRSLRASRRPHNPQKEDRSLRGGERTGNGRRMREAAVTRAYLSETAPAN